MFKAVSVAEMYSFSKGCKKIEHKVRHQFVCRQPFDTP
jgi:hypothetical protein